MSGIIRVVGLATVAAVSAACDLTDVDIVDIGPEVVAEIYVTVGDTPSENTLLAFVHGNEAGGAPSSAAFDDAVITVTDDEGADFVLALDLVEECVVNGPDDVGGSCFTADAALTSSIVPGDSVGVRVVLADGRTLAGATALPEAFQIDGVGTTCRVPPDTLVPLAWTRATGAWAYVSETLILGLDDALSGEGIEAPDSLQLLGLSISESDTTIVFPSEFGIFDRFDLDRDLAVRLQEGLPEGTTADVAITAVERNYVNWVRGGSFNPSGQVRVSSLVGDGSGVLGAAVTRRFSVVSTTDTSAGPDCPES